jgi:hypothetical protein
LAQHHCNQCLIVNSDANVTLNDAAQYGMSDFYANGVQINPDASLTANERVNLTNVVIDQGSTLTVGRPVARCLHPHRTRDGLYRRPLEQRRITAGESNVNNAAGADWINLGNIQRGTDVPALIEHIWNNTAAAETGGFN